MRFQRSIFWLRRDFRLEDNVALSAATRFSKEVVLVFIFDTNILNRLKDKNDRRMTAIHNSLLELDQKIRKKGSALVLLHGDPKKEILELSKTKKISFQEYQSITDDFGKILYINSINVLNIINE